MWWSGPGHGITAARQVHRGGWMREVRRVEAMCGSRPGMLGEGVTQACEHVERPDRVGTARRPWAWPRGDRA